MEMCNQAFVRYGPTASRNGPDVMIIRNRKTGMRVTRRATPAVTPEKCGEHTPVQWEISGDPRDVLRRKLPSWSSGDPHRRLASNRRVHLLECNGGGFRNWKFGF